MTDPPTAAECNAEAEARVGMGTVARKTKLTIEPVPSEFRNHWQLGKFQ